MKLPFSVKSVFPLTLAAGLLSSATSHAVVLIDTISGEQPIGGANRTVGALFTVGTFNLSVTHLGAYDSSPDGFSNTHQVGLWTSGGTLLGSLTLPTGTGTTKIGDFRYAALGSAVTLTAGQSYVIGAAYGSSGDAAGWAVDGGLAAIPITYSSHVTTLNSQRYRTGSFGMPNLDFGFGLLGANMQFTVVPEPQQWAAMTALGLLGFGVWRRQRGSRQVA